MDNPKVQEELNDLSKKVKQKIELSNRRKNFRNSKNTSTEDENSFENDALSTQPNTLTERTQTDERMETQNDTRETATDAWALRLKPDPASEDDTDQDKENSSEEDERLNQMTEIEEDVKRDRKEREQQKERRLRDKMKEVFLTDERTETSQDGKRKRDTEEEERVSPPSTRSRQDKFENDTDTEEDLTDIDADGELTDINEELTDSGDETQEGYDTRNLELSRILEEERNKVRETAERQENLRLELEEIKTKARRRENELQERIEEQLREKEEKEKIIRENQLNEEEQELAIEGAMYYKEEIKTQEARLEKYKKIELHLLEAQKEREESHANDMQEAKAIVKAIKEETEKRKNNIEKTNREITELKRTIREHCDEVEETKRSSTSMSVRSNDNKWITTFQTEDKTERLTPENGDNEELSKTEEEGEESREEMIKTIGKHVWTKRQHCTTFHDYIKALKLTTERYAENGYPSDIIADGLHNHIMTTPIVSLYINTHRYHNIKTPKGVLNALTATDVTYQNTTPEEKFEQIERAKNEELGALMTRIKVSWLDKERDKKSHTESEEKREEIATRKIKEQFYKAARIPEQIIKGLRTCGDLSQIVQFVQEDIESMRRNTQQNWRRHETPTNIRWYRPRDHWRRHDRKREQQRYSYNNNHCLVRPQYQQNEGSHPSNVPNAPNTPPLTGQPNQSQLRPENPNTTSRDYETPNQNQNPTETSAPTNGTNQQGPGKGDPQMTTMRIDKIINSWSKQTPLDYANNIRYMTPRAPTGREFTSDKKICSKCRRYGHLKPECTQIEYCSYCNRESGHSDDQHHHAKDWTDQNWQNEKNM